jgi:hypothetical protein
VCVDIYRRLVVIWPGRLSFWEHGRSFSHTEAENMDNHAEYGPVITRSDEEELAPTWLYVVRLIVMVIGLVVLATSWVRTAPIGVVIGLMIVVGGYYGAKRVRRALPKRYCVTVSTRRYGPYHFVREAKQLKPKKGMRILAIYNKDGSTEYRVTGGTGPLAVSESYR